MAEFPKKLLPEVLPAPTRPPARSSVRQHVLRHLDELRRFGAATGAATVAACACVACDPIPAPAICDNHSVEQFTATAVRRTDTIELRIQWAPGPTGSPPWTFVDTSGVIGAAIVSSTIDSDGQGITLTLRPDPAAAVIQLDLRTTCNPDDTSTRPGVLSAVLSVNDTDAGDPGDGSSIAIQLHFR